MIRAVISIGTNSTRLLIADVGSVPARLLLRRSIGTRIGEGLRSSGLLRPAAMQRTLDAVRDYLAAAREQTQDLAVIATSAVRRAQNAGEFTAKLEALTDTPTEILSGEEEARCSFIGAVSGMERRPQARFGVADIGGGSTEYAVGTHGPERMLSCEIGAVRLLELVPLLDGAHGAVPEKAMTRAHAIAAESLRALETFPAAERLLVVGGTATTAALLIHGPAGFPTRSAVTLSDVDALSARISVLPLGERKVLPGLPLQRADIILAGLVIFARILAIAGPDAIVTTDDLLLGVLLR